MTKPDQNPAKRPAANPDGSHLERKRILITRPEISAKLFADKLTSEQGAISVLHPVIEILAPASWSAVDDAIARFSEFDWIVFVSANGPAYFVKRMLELNPDDGEAIQRVKIAAIGKRSVADLTQPGVLTVSGCNIDLLPEISNSEGLANSLIENVSDDERILLVRGNRGSDELGSLLKAASVQFEEVVAYLSSDIATANAAVTDQLNDGQIDWVTITSPAIAAATIKLFAGELKKSKTKLVSISPNTTARLAELGFPPTAEAKEFNMNGVVQAMLDWEARLGDAG